MTEVIYFVLINGSLLALGILGSWVLSNIRIESSLSLIAWVCICALSCSLMSPVVAALGWLLSIPTNQEVLLAASFSIVYASMLLFKGHQSRKD